MLRLTSRDAVMASLMVVAACTADEQGSPTDSGAARGPRDATQVAMDSGASGAMDAFFADATASAPDATSVDAAAPPVDAGEPDAGMMMGLCPPQGPFGANQGDTAPPLMLTDCEGNQHNLHDLCQKRASWFFVFAGW